MSLFMIGLKLTVKTAKLTENDWQLQNYALAIPVYTEMFLR